jgi:hypothetical protein
MRHETIFRDRRSCLNRHRAMGRRRPTAAIAPRIGCRKPAACAATFTATDDDLRSLDQLRRSVRRSPGAYAPL